MNKIKVPRCLPLEALQLNYPSTEQLVQEYWDFLRELSAIVPDPIQAKKLLLQEFVELSDQRANDLAHYFSQIKKERASWEQET